MAITTRVPTGMTPRMAGHLGVTVGMTVGVLNGMGPVGMWVTHGFSLPPANQMGRALRPAPLWKVSLRLGDR